MEVQGDVSKQNWFAKLFFVPLWQAATKEIHIILYCMSHSEMFIWWKWKRNVLARWISMVGYSFSPHEVAGSLSVFLFFLLCHLRFYSLWQGSTWQAAPCEQWKGPSERWMDHWSGFREHIALSAMWVRSGLSLSGGLDRGRQKQCEDWSVKISWYHWRRVTLLRPTSLTFKENVHLTSDGVLSAILGPSLFLFPLLSLPSSWLCVVHSVLIPLRVLPSSCPISSALFALCSVCLCINRLKTGCQNFSWSTANVYMNKLKHTVSWPELPWKLEFLIYVNIKKKSLEEHPNGLNQSFVSKDNYSSTKPWGKKCL